MPVLTFKNPEGKTIKVNSPDGSIPSEQELDSLFSASTSPVDKAIGKVVDASKSYLKNAQPAFKLAVTHPETLAGLPAMKQGGIPLDPSELERETSKDWADIYRDANLPGSKSGSFVGQLLPEAAGAMLDLGTKASTYVAPKLVEGAGIAASQVPALRAGMEKYLPTFTGDILKKYPAGSFNNIFSGTSGGVDPATLPPPNPYAGKPLDELKVVLKNQEASFANQIKGEEMNQIQLQAGADKIVNNAPKVARQVGLNLRNTETFAPAFNKKYQSFGAGLNFVTKDVNIPEEGVKNILLDAGQKHGLLDASGKVLKAAPTGAEKKFLTVAQRYGAIASGADATVDPLTAGLPKTTVSQVKALHAGDPTAQRLIFEQLQKEQAAKITPQGFGYQEGDYTHQGTTINLRQLLDEVAGVEDSASKGVPQASDRIVTNLHRSTMNYLDQNAEKIGFDEAKQAVYKKIKAAYRPFADFKNTFYETVDPYNDKGVYDTKKITDLLTRHATGTATPDETQFVNGIKQFIDPNFDMRLELHRSSLGKINQAVSESQNRAYMAGLQKEEVGKWGQLKDALDNAKDEAGKFQALHNMENFLTTYTPKRVAYGVLNSLTRKILR